MGDQAVSATAAAPHSSSSRSEIDEMKRLLRRQIAAALRGLGPGEIAAQSLRLAERVGALPEFVGARAISVYLHMPHEAQTESILSAAFDAHKKVYVPKILGRTPDDMKMVQALSAHDIASFPRVSATPGGVEQALAMVRAAV
jgi:5-formyltetrahydrofolate cyclo-ligase